MEENNTFVIAISYYDNNHGKLHSCCDYFLGTEEEVIDYIDNLITYELKEHILK